MKKKVLIADSLSKDGVKILESSDLLEVTNNSKTTKEDLLEIIKDYHVLIIRSATKVTSEVLEKAKNLELVVRAGVGVDNIDIRSCSQHGVIVMNAPAGNSISTAEQAIALLFSMARNIPQAYSSMKNNLWEKKNFVGVQITGRTIGVIGLGRIGKEVVRRARGLQMKIIGYDPYIPAEKLEHLQIELVDLETLLSSADAITVHTPLTDVTRGIINSKNLSKLRDGVFLINCARGGIYCENALLEGLESGKIGGVGLDVLEQEPPEANNPLVHHPKCVTTPHLGASTDEAQSEVAKETATSIVQFLGDGTAMNALNYASLSGAELDVLADWFLLSEKMGLLVSALSTESPRDIHIYFSGTIIELNLKPLEVAFLKGFLSFCLGNEAVNLVNTSLLAEERGISLSIKNLNEEVSNSIRIKTNTIEIEGTVTDRARIVSINKNRVDYSPNGHALFVQNFDVPNVVGLLGNILGENNINIASLSLAREKKGGKVFTLIDVDDVVSKNTLDKISDHKEIISAVYLDFSCVHL